MRTPPRSVLLAAAGTMAVALCAASTPATAADVQVPDLGRFVWTARVNGPFVGTVNAVQASAEATVVYVSVGTGAEGATGKATDFLGYGEPTTEDITAGADSSLRLLRVIDRAGGKVYRPLQTTAEPECLCTSMTEIPTFDPKTQLLTFAAILPALPAGTTTVDVDVTGRGMVVPDVEVTQGSALTPAEGGGQAVVMGTAWPEVDLAAAAAVTDTKPFITDLIAYTEDLDKTQRTEKTPTKTDISVAADVLFAVDKATLSSRAQAQLARVATQIKGTSAGGTVTVTGYTDSDGSDSYNLDLSKRRAAAVVSALQSLAPGTKFAAVGKGEADPVASNSSSDGKQLNRRVTISFASKGGN